MVKPLVERISFGTTVLMLPIVFGVVYLMYLAVPYFKKAYSYLFRAGGSSMNVDGRQVFHEESCPICLEHIDLEVSGTCGHTFCGITKA
jgi:hypothetical protein